MKAVKKKGNLHQDIYTRGNQTSSAAFKYSKRSLDKRNTENGINGTEGTLLQVQVEAKAKFTDKEKESSGY